MSRRVEATTAGICRFHDSLGCSDKTNCRKCGWNPENGVKERRVAVAMREYRRKLRAGEIHPPW